MNYRPLVQSPFSPVASGEMPRRIRKITQLSCVFVPFLAFCQPLLCLQLLSAFAHPGRGIPHQHWLTFLAFTLVSPLCSPWDLWVREWEADSNLNSILVQSLVSRRLALPVCTFYRPLRTLHSPSLRPRGVHLHSIYVYTCENPLFNEGIFTFLRWISSTL